MSQKKIPNDPFEVDVFDAGTQKYRVEQERKTVKAAAGRVQIAARVLPETKEALLMHKARTGIPIEQTMEAAIREKLNI